MVEKNDRGQMLLDPLALAKQAAGGNFSRYNGGWVKRVTKLDKRQTNGYSLVGDFLKAGMQWVSPGVYLDCSIAGSRKHPDKHYTLFRLQRDGTVENVAEVENRRDWAVKLWPAIETALADVKAVADPEAKLQELLARKAQLENELDFVNEAIKVLTAPATE